MENEIAKIILLTGAGFTKNFGGFLAGDMWSKIFNNDQVQNQPQLRDLLMEDYDFESIYYKVISGEYKDDEKNALNTATFEAYQTLDDIVREWKFNEDAPNPVNIYKVNEFIEYFAGQNQQLGFFFTLNQDLFIERHFNTRKKPLTYPGITTIPINNGHPLNKEDYITLPIENQRKKQLSNKNFHYVKLHGSFGWKSSDGADRLVIGRDKADQISREPLLAWYFELFQNELLQNQRKLLVIGYGFRDNHINKVIADAVAQYGLKIYVISPDEPMKFIKELRENKPHGESIFRGLSEYFPYRLLEVFPSDQSESNAWREIKDILFK